LKEQEGFQEMTLPIKVDQQEITAFCRKHHLTKLAFFGSMLTDRFGPDSDVDVLFEYDLVHIPSLFDIASMERELSGILGRKVDMRTPADLSRYFRDEVVRNAIVQYAA
jgi:predicted nucleotidyltransferase